jgi:hypothetical protein
VLFRSLWSEVRDLVKQKCEEINSDPVIDISIVFRVQDEWQFGIAVGPFSIRVKGHLLGRTIEVVPTGGHSRYYRRFQMQLYGVKCYLVNSEDQFPSVSPEVVAEDIVDALLGLRTI